MCGIFGFLDHQSRHTPDEVRLRETAALLAHRGPDHREVFSEPSAGLVSTRLSLVDPDPRSHQPFWDRTGRHALVYNGEIYNYREIRKALEQRAVAFRTSGDTEVLLEAILNDGLQEALRKAEGMFAFGLYDRQERSLILARDRVGMKPLYVYDDGCRFVFSSEIQAMRPWIPWRADPMRIAPYLSGLQGVTDGAALFEGVRSVAPGSIVRVKAGERPTFEPFFALSDFWDPDERERLGERSPRQAVDLVEERLLESVRLQLRADAPLGICCSGGVDSSLVAAMTSRLRGDIALFHSNVVGRHSEYGAARALARFLRCELVSCDVRDEDYLERIPDVMRYAEYPYRHLRTSPPFLMIAETARSRSVKGLLTGEGADECFWGYPHHAPNLLRWIRQAPRNSFQVLKRALAGVPADPFPAPGDFVSQFHQRFPAALEKEDIYRAVAAKSRGAIRPEQLLSLYDFTDNIRSLNHRNDSMGMAAGVECRFPFLDSGVIRTAVNLPERCKLRLSPTALDRHHLFIRDKWVLRKVADRYLPRSMSRRIKRPWPNTFLERIETGPGFFEGGCLEEWLQLSRREIAYFAAHAPPSLATALLCLEVWAHVCFHQYPREAIVQRIRDHVRMRPETGARIDPWSGDPGRFPL